MKKFISIIGLVFIITALLSPVVLLAQEKEKETYVPLENLSINNSSEILNDDGSTNLQTYLPGMLRIFFGVTSALAVIFIIIGGLEYVTAESVNSKSDGKQKIEAVIFGIIILAISWALLNTINPALLKVDLSEDSLNVSGTTNGTTGYVQDTEIGALKYCIIVNGIKSCGHSRAEAYEKIQSLPDREVTLEEDRSVRITYTAPLSPDSSFSPNLKLGPEKTRVFTTSKESNAFRESLKLKFAEVESFTTTTLEDGTSAIKIIYRLPELTYIEKTEIISRRDLLTRRDEIVAAGGTLSTNLIPIISNTE